MIDAISGKHMPSLTAHSTKFKELLEQSYNPSSPAKHKHYKDFLYDG